MNPTTPHRLRRAFLPFALAASLAFLAPLAGAQARLSPVALSIAAQPLATALRELSSATGVLFAFPPALLAGKTAPGIEGNFTARQAAERLLEGSGLMVIQDGDTLIIQPVPAPRSVAPGEEAMLSEVTVSAQGERETLTEGTGSYTTGATSVTTKLPLTLRETPQTITVITRQQMDDFGLNSVDGGC
jgi:hypothetical protein